jgi:hypothetical protein
VADFSCCGRPRSGCTSLHRSARRIGGDPPSSRSRLRCRRADALKTTAPDAWAAVDRGAAVVLDVRSIIGGMSAYRRDELPIERPS